MEFEWDESRRVENIEKPVFDFLDAWKAFHDFLLVRKDTWKEYGEERSQGIGKVDGIVIVVVFTKRSDRIRIISFRKGNKNEKHGEERIRNEKESFEDSTDQSP